MRRGPRASLALVGVALLGLACAEYVLAPGERAVRGLQLDSLRYTVDEGQRVPIVATAVGGVPELVTPARTGWLAAPNDPPGLAAVITRLLTNPEKCRDYGRAGRERAVRDFSLETMARRYEDLLDRLLARAGD